MCSSPLPRRETLLASFAVHRLFCLAALRLGVRSSASAPGRRDRRDHKDNRDTRDNRRRRPVLAGLVRSVSSLCLGVRSGLVSSVESVQSVDGPRVLLPEPWVLSFISVHRCSSVVTSPDPRSRSRTRSRSIGAVESAPSDPPWGWATPATSSIGTSGRPSGPNAAASSPRPPCASSLLRFPLPE